jgi:2-succinyl-5-enolpyruvyl-6-hydroxy-3-cyclohexene-1-carboxylate synthase
MKNDAPVQHAIRSVADAPNATYASTLAFFEELYRCGLIHVCISPGSRSTPLAVAAGSVVGLQAWSHLDERAAAFFALGLAKASRSPVALVCTSGTALANYAPAIIEAHYAGVPLIVLSADRPHELRACGAGQTIDQVKIFGAHVRFFAELPIPEAGPSMLRHVRSMACRAVAESRGAAPGPVHLNWPFREPLEPVRQEHSGQSSPALSIEESVAQSGRPNGLPYVQMSCELPRASTLQVEELATDFLDCEQGVIACGVMDEPEFGRAVVRLGKLLGWPVLAEPTSGLRSGPHLNDGAIVAGSDLFLRDPDFKAQHLPRIVLRFGATPVSKAFRLWLEATPPEKLVLVSSAGGWDEPSHLSSDYLHWIRWICVSDSTTKSRSAERTREEARGCRIFSTPMYARKTCSTVTWMTRTGCSNPGRPGACSNICPIDRFYTCLIVCRCGISTHSCPLAVPSFGCLRTAAPTGLMASFRVHWGLRPPEKSTSFC